VVPTYYPATRYGGPIRSVHGLCRGLAALGHNVTVYTTNVDGKGTFPPDSQENTNIDGVTVNYYRCGIGRRLYRSPELSAALSKNILSYDVVHLHSVYLWPTYKSARLAYRKQVPYVVSPRGMLVRELIRKRGRLRKNLWISAFEMKTLGQAALVHVTSRLEQKELVRFDFDIRNLEIIPNGVNTPRRIAADNIDRSESSMLIVLCLGRISWKKGLDRLVESIPHWIRNCRFIIAGGDEEGYRASLESLAKRIGVADRIEFTGEVDDDEKWRLISSASVVALTSYQENFGNVVLEAMAVSKPVVVTPEVGAAEIVEEHNAGLVVRGDPLEIANALNKLLGEPGLRKEMGARGRAAITKSYSWEHIAGVMAEKYHEIIYSCPR